MSKSSVTISKQHELKPAEDFYRLRREGIGFIEQMGSSLWTDYNAHDPGITILEALCYAITDLAYRTGWDIKDIIVPASPSSDPKEPFPNQPFFTAREILAVNPLTPDDLRLLLIDLDAVRNAWVSCSECACGLHYYAWCENGGLKLSCQPPDDARLNAQKVQPVGFYDILLELEPDLTEEHQEKAIEQAKKTLFSHRNLCEDYFCVKVVEIENVAVCAEVEVKSDVDIELVQAKIWFAIEQYFNPPIQFHSLQELMDAKIPVEEIFNGPKLKNGFLKKEELEAAELKAALRTSDIINLLMDIDGVISVNNLLLSKYDAEGNVIKGAADPTWHNDHPVFDANKSSAAWLLSVSPLHQPSLYRDQSRFLFYKNGLPFKASMDESRDMLTQLHGEAERPKNKDADNDLTVPSGTFRNIEDYFPVQHSLPLAYGIGPEGLPAHASPLRQAQAKQLKAYLMFFEQVFANAFAQLAHTADLFSLDPKIQQTYFFRQFSEDIIKGYCELINIDCLDEMEGMIETLPEFLKRRNRFLDHIVSRFGEQFSGYALMLTTSDGKSTAPDRLIEDKIAFLKAYPQISHDRARAFDYTANPCASSNMPGIKKRILLLLGQDVLSSTNRMIVVEHLLLRPKFPGDALYFSCSAGECRSCGDEDPYSFRLTFVMPGWMKPFNTNMEMRSFAERTIQQETPSHLLCKICWVAETQFKEFEAGWRNWIEINAKFDWTEESLPECVQDILSGNLIDRNKAADVNLDKYASNILAQYGSKFHCWINKAVAEGDFLDDIKKLKDFIIPEFSISTDYFNDAAAKQLKLLLEECYSDYAEVSYRLRIVVNLLSELNNIYPSATLHDCDEGNDRNPMRLGKTALGKSTVNIDES